MVLPYYYKNDPDGACDKLVKEATLAWKREDDVVDDITIIVIFLKSEWIIKVYYISRLQLKFT